MNPKTAASSNRQSVSMNDDQTIAQSLRDHRLIRRATPENPSLMRAISICLFGIPTHESLVMKKCVDYAKSCIKSNRIPQKLQQLQNESSQYFTSPASSDFTNLNLELISLAFERRVVLYSLSKHLVLKSLVFNNRFTTSIQLFSFKGRFDPIFEEDQSQNNKKNTEYNAASINNKQKFLLEEEVDDNNQQPVNRRRHKRSISDSQFGDDASNGATPQNSNNNANSQGYNLFGDYSNQDFIQSLIRDKKDSVPNGRANQNTQSAQQQELLDPSSRRQPRSKPLKPPNSPSTPKLNQPNDPIGIIHVLDSYDEDSGIDDDNCYYTEEPSAIPPYRAPAVAASSSTSGKIAIKIVKHVDDQNLFNETNAIDHSVSTEHTGHGISNSYSNMFTSKVYKQQQQQQQNQYSQQFCLNPPKIRQTTSRSVSPNQVIPASAQQRNQAPPILSTQSSMLNPNDFLSISQQKQNNLQRQNSNYSVGAEHQAVAPGVLYTASNQRMLKSSMSNSTGSNNGATSIGLATSGNQQQTTEQISDAMKKKILMMENSNGAERYQGTLKFFDQEKNFGFIFLDEPKMDIFVHFDDLQKAGIFKNILQTNKQIRFQFSLMLYVGKYKESLKAVDIQILSDQPPFEPLNQAQLRQLSNEMYAQQAAAAGNSPANNPPYHSGSTQQQQQPMQPRLHSPTGSAGVIPPGMLDQQPAAQQPGYLQYPQSYAGASFLGVPPMNHHSMHPNQPGNNLKVPPVNMYGMSPQNAQAYMNQVQYQQTFYQQQQQQGFFGSNSSPQQQKLSPNGSKKGSQNFLPL